MKKVTLFLSGLALLATLLVPNAALNTTTISAQEHDPCGGYIFCTTLGNFCRRGGDQCQLDCTGPQTPTPGPGTGLSAG